MDIHLVTMTNTEASEIVSQIAALDYNGEESCTAQDARRAMELARKPGYCQVDLAPEAIAFLGVEHAALVYVLAWEDCHSNEYAED